MVHIHSVAHHKFKKNGVDLQVYIIKGSSGCGKSRKMKILASEGEKINDEY